MSAGRGILGNALSSLTARSTDSVSSAVATALHRLVASSARANCSIESAYNAEATRCSTNEEAYPAEAFVIVSTKAKTLTRAGKGILGLTTRSPMRCFVDYRSITGIDLSLTAAHWSRARWGFAWHSQRCELQQRGTCSNFSWRLVVGGQDLLGVRLAGGTSWQVSLAGCTARPVGVASVASFLQRRAFCCRAGSTRHPAASGALAVGKQQLSRRSCHRTFPGRGHTVGDELAEAAPARVVRQVAEVAGATDVEIVGMARFIIASVLAALKAQSLADLRGWHTLHGLLMSASWELVVVEEHSTRRQVTGIRRDPSCSIPRVVRCLLLLALTSWPGLPLPLAGAAGASR